MSLSVPSASAPLDPTEPLEPVPIRRWPQPIGFLFFVWSLLAVCVTTIVLVICTFACMPFDRSGRGKWFFTQLWSRCVMGISGAKVEVHHEGPVPEGPVLFLCNHQGALDITALFLALPKPFVFVAKRSVFSYPFLGWYIGAAGYIPVDRANRESAIRNLEAAGDRIRQSGQSVTVFPEGTRSADGSVLPFKKGPFMMAIRSGIPIVPVAIEGTLHVAPKRRWYVCPNTVRVLVGQPVTTQGVTPERRDALMTEVRSTIIRMHRRLGGLGGDEANAIASAGVEGISRPAPLETTH